jgi:hypothetical protein
MPIRHPVHAWTRNAVTIGAAAVAIIASVELIAHDTQRPAYAAMLPVPARAAAASPGAAPLPGPSATPAMDGPLLEDLELVGRSIANYDR